MSNLQEKKLKLLLELNEELNETMKLLKDQNYNLNYDIEDIKQKINTIRTQIRILLLQNVE